MKDKNNPFEESWIILERKVVEKFESTGWIVQTKQHYIDPFEGKPREIDIIATKHVIIGDNPRQRMWWFDPINYEIKIFLECKYLTEKKWLLIRKSNKQKNITSFLDVGLYNNLCADFYKKYKQISDTYKEHRYLSSEYVAYDSTDNSERWFGIPAIKQITHGLMSKTHRSRERYSIEYPAIIANASDNIIIRYDWSEDNFAFPKSLLFEFDYVDKNENKKSFLVDVLSFDELDSFIKDRNDEFENMRKNVFEDESFRQDSERKNSNWRIQNNFYSDLL